MTGSVCALGFFDGVHKAHSYILTECVRYAQINGLKSVALTFEKSPAEYFGKKIKYLTSLPQKEALMKQLGIDDVVILACDEKMLSLTPEEFIDKILVEKLNAKALFCGFNYTFGKGAKGDTHLLEQMCGKYGIKVFVSSCMKEDDVTVSSSNIRTFLEKGDIEKANSFLTRPFEVCGKVQKGKELGRTLSFPTANIYPDSSFPHIPHGVYATKTTVDATEYLSVTNIGFNPTVNDKNLRMETYIIGFSGDIYGKHISVKFYKFLREEKKFPSVENLREQIEKDKKTTIKYFQELH